MRTTDQADNVAAMNTASQAFLLQANDLIVDGLNAIERDQLFGTKLFAIGEGTYSKYDVADDLKINGWNGLVGTGDVSRKQDGDLSWAVFFEFGDANSSFHFDFGDASHRTDSKFHYRGGGLAPSLSLEQRLVLGRLGTRRHHPHEGGKLLPQQQRGILRPSPPHGLLVSPCGDRAGVRNERYGRT